MLAMVEDLVLRAVWTLNISVGEAGAEVLTQDTVSSILAVLELSRWVGSQCLFVCLFVSTVEPRLTDTPQQRTPTI